MPNSLDDFEPEDSPPVNADDSSTDETPDDELVTLNVEVPKRLRKRMHMEKVIQERTIRSMVHEALREWLEANGKAQ